MAGSVVDLSQPGASFPAVTVVDTNVIVEDLLASFLDPPALPAAHLTQFFDDLLAINGRGIVTPTAFTELVHVLVGARYRHEYGRMSASDRNARYASPVRCWRDLYKQDRPSSKPFSRIWTSSGAS
jgi:hypothetical protein